MPKVHDTAGSTRACRSGLRDEGKKREGVWEREWLWCGCGGWGRESGHGRERERERERENEKRVGVSVGQGVWCRPGEASPNVHQGAALGHAAAVAHAVKDLLHAGLRDGAVDALDALASAQLVLSAGSKAR